MADHDLFFTRITAVREGRLHEAPLLYSSRLGWRVTGDKAREPGTSIRDQLLERLAALDEPGRRYWTRLMIWNIGMYSATTMPPTAPPMTTMSSGSSSEVSASTRASISAS